MKPIYLANNGGIYHFCKGKEKTRSHVYRCYYIQNKENYECNKCFIELPGMLFLAHSLRQRPYRGKTLFYTVSGHDDYYIKKERFKKLYNPKQIWSVAQK